MGKILVELQIPSISEAYEIYIQLDMKVEELIKLITVSLNKITNGKYTSSGQEVLCLKNTSTKLYRFTNVCDYDIKNGDTLILI